MPTGETVRTVAAGDEALAQAGRAIAAGELVVAPTETVYGVFGTDRSTLARLVGEDTARAAAVHAGEVGPAVESLGGLSAWHRRLLGRLLPGAVTVVAGDRAVRVPDDEPCRRMLNAAAGAGAGDVLGVALPFGDGRDVSALDDGARARLAEAGVTLVIEAGPTRLGSRSTVIRLTDSGYEVVRGGAIEPRYLEKLAAMRVLFVCTGNTCRSPMAAAITRDLLADDPFATVDSAGVAAGGGAPMTPEARAALRAIGVEPGSHTSRQLTEQDLRSADLVFAMTGDHLELLGDARTRGGSRPVVLDPEGGDVPDPIGGPAEVYDATCRRIREMVSRRIEALDPAARPPSGPGDSP